MASRALGSLTIDLIAKTAGFEQGMDRAARTADKRMKQIEARAYKFGRILGSTLAVGAAAASAALIKLTFDAIKYADELDELSQRTGISAQQLSKWGYAAKLSGTDLEGLTRGVTLLSKNLAQAADTDSKMGRLFQTLGIAVKDAEGNLRDVEEVLPEIADRFKSLDNTTTETALALQLFGRSGAELLEFLNRGSQGIDALGQELSDLGGVIDNETAAAAAEFKDELDRLKQSGIGLGTAIAAELLPSLTEAAKDFRELVKEGDLATNVVALLSGALSFGVGILDEYNNAVARTTIAIGVFAEAGEAMKMAATGGILGQLAAINKVNAALKDGQSELDRLIARQNSPFRGVSSRVLPGGGGAGGSVDTDALNRALSGQGGGSKKKAGKSDAEKEAEALQKAYESLMASMQERIALFGKEGEAAKVRYDIEHGSLMGISDALAQQAIARAEEYDQMVLMAELHEAAAKAAEEESDRIKNGLKDGKELLQDLQFELELMKMTNEERATAIQLRGLESEAIAEYGEAIAQANRDIEESMKEIEMMDGFRNSFANFFEDVLSGTKSVKDAFTDMLDDINQQILRRITQNWVDQLFGQAGTSQQGSTDGWIQMIVGLFGGGKASGGWANPNTMYEVNERGLEMATVGGRDYMLTGSKPVEITPNHKLGGGLSQVINVAMQGKFEAKNADQIGQETARRWQIARARNS